MSRLQPLRTIGISTSVWSNRRQRSNTKCKAWRCQQKVKSQTSAIKAGKEWRGGYLWKTRCTRYETERQSHYWSRYLFGSGRAIQKKVNKYCVSKENLQRVRKCEEYFFTSLYWLKCQSHFQTRCKLLTHTVYLLPEIRWIKVINLKIMVML